MKVFLLISTLYGELSPIHKEGYCVMMDQCGPEDKGLFGRPLNCLNNTKATLVCGSKFNIKNGICCRANQMKVLRENLKTLYNLVNHCPACWFNLQQFFCTLTCSPNQSQFLNVTQVKQSPVTGRTIVTEIDFYIEPKYGNRMFRSCKEVKFLNGFVLDFISGGAKDYLTMLRFMGMKSPFGSPFQINFPNPKSFPNSEIRPLNLTTENCFNNNEYRCTCIDCSKQCPQIKIPKSPFQLEANLKCFGVSCFTFILMLIYMLFSFTIGYKFVYRRYNYYAENSTPHAEDTEETPLIMTNKKNLTNNLFFKIGFGCALKPINTILFMAIFVFLCCFGFFRFEVETNPEYLWVPKSSKVINEKQIFEKNFGKFYRTEQIIVKMKTLNETIIQSKIIEKIFDLESEIQRLNSNQLNKICYKPLGAECLIQSITSYWNHDKDEFLDDDDFLSKFDSCVLNPSSCLPPSGVPIKPDYILGGSQIDIKNSTEKLYKKSSTLIITYIINNSNKKKNEILEWEKSLESLLIDQTVFNSKNVLLTFRTENSIETELNKSSQQDFDIILLSYIVMIIYVSLSLGNYKFQYSISKMKVYQNLFYCKISLGFSGILLVAFSILSSIGILSMIGIKTSLIIGEVIPFLVLAIGVDNIYLIVNEFEKLEKINLESLQSNHNSTIRLSIQQIAAESLSNIGPSLLLSSACEVTAFLLASLAPMPAISTFSLYAALSIFINFIFQITVFIALLVLDSKRKENQIMDVLWVRPDIRLEPIESIKPRIENIFESHYLPIIFNENIKNIILFLFFASFVFNFSLLPHIQLGLDERIALPKNSYLINYFTILNNDYRIGPPVYFNIIDIKTNVAELKGQSGICGKSLSCFNYSISNILEVERFRSSISKMNEPASNWMDDFISWLNPNINCCKIRKGNLCSRFEDNCVPCMKNQIPKWDNTLNWMPKNDDFIMYLKAWLNDVPDQDCPFAGKALYSKSIRIKKDKVEGYNFQSFHSPVKNQKGYIESYRQAERISKELENFYLKNLGKKRIKGLKVFPYSPFYIFFEQYFYIAPLTIYLLGLSLIAFFLWNCYRLNIKLSGLMTLTLLMILINIVGLNTLVLPYLFGEKWRVQLNGISMVNFLIGLGISVEFVSHFGQQYYNIIQDSEIKSTPLENSQLTSKIILPTTFKGIVLTKIIGIMVLGYAQSNLFLLYFFQVYFSIILVATFHGFLFLPVLFSVLGSD